jgi:hypothetical protein
MFSGTCIVHILPYTATPILSTICVQAALHATRQGDLQASMPGACCRAGHGEQFSANRCWVVDCRALVYILWPGCQRGVVVGGGFTPRVHMAGVVVLPTQLDVGQPPPLYVCQAMCIQLLSC